MKAGTRIAWAQRAARTKPLLAPNTEYCLSGSRWEMMMRLAQMGASDAVIKRRIVGIDDETIAVMRKIACGDISKGRRMVIIPEVGEDESGQAAG